MTEEVEVKRGPGRPRKIDVAEVEFTATGGGVASHNVMPINYTEKPRKFPIKLLRGYFPKDEDHPKQPATGDPVKVLRHEVVLLDYAEAKSLIDAGIAERADALP